MADCNVTADTTVVTADQTDVTADGKYTGCTEECVATADSTLITADSTSVTADGYNPACNDCAITADSTVITADSTTVTADGLDSVCGGEVEEEEPYRLGLGPDDEYDDLVAQLRREDELILLVIKKFVEQQSLRAA